MNSTILIVDDNNDLRKLIRLTLEADFYELHEAATGQRALHLLPSIQPDLVILDVMMPGGLNGYEVCREIKSQLGDRSRVIMLTARGQSKDRNEAVRSGADDYLVKPFSPLELLEAVQRQLLAAQHLDLAPAAAGGQAQQRVE